MLNEYFASEYLKEVPRAWPVPGQKARTRFDRDLEQNPELLAGHYL